MSQTVIIGMELPSLVACGGFAADGVTRLVNPTYYDPENELTSDGSAIVIGEGTFYPPLSDPTFPKHLQAAWTTRGWRSIRFNGSTTIQQTLLTGSSLINITVPFDFTLTRSDPTPVKRRKLADVSGTPNRTYAYSTSPVRLIGAGRGNPQPSASLIPGINVAGNASAGIVFDWSLPGSLGIADEQVIGTVLGVSTAFVYPSITDPDAGTSTGTTPVNAQISAVVYGNCASAIDGYPIIFYFGLRVELVPSDTSGPRWAAYDTGGDPGPLEDVEDHIPYFGCTLAQSIWDLGSPPTLIDGVGIGSDADGDACVASSRLAVTNDSSGTWSALAVTFSGESRFT